MTEFLKAFQRNQDGSWTCVTRAVYVDREARIQVTPGTTFTRGTSIMGVDLVEWLERQRETVSRRSAARA